MFISTKIIIPVNNPQNIPVKKRPIIIVSYDFINFDIVSSIAATATNEFVATNDVFLLSKALDQNEIA
jgi:hypothetical protein